MNIEKLVSHSRVRFDHETAKKVLKEKYQAKLVFAYNGGMWRAGPELQNIISTCLEEELVLLDLYENPVRVNTKELMTMSQQRWQEQMNAWLVEYEQLNKNR